MVHVTAIFNNEISFHSFTVKYSLYQKLWKPDFKRFQTLYLDSILRFLILISSLYKLLNIFYIDTSYLTLKTPLHLWCSQAIVHKKHNIQCNQWYVSYHSVSILHQYAFNTQKQNKKSVGKALRILPNNNQTF